MVLLYGSIIIQSFFINILFYFVRTNYVMYYGEQKKPAHMSNFS